MISAQGASAFSQTSHRQTIFLSSGDASVFVRRAEEQLATQAWGRRIDDLLRLRSLKDNWDGEGTEAPPTTLVDRAIGLAQTLLKERDWLPPPHRIIAGVNGTIFFEWHASWGYLEIEVLSPLKIEVRLVPKGTNTTQVDMISVPTASSP